MRRALTILHPGPTGCQVAREPTHGPTRQPVTHAEPAWGKAKKKRSISADASGPRTSV